MTKLSVKIYNPCWAVDVAADWGISAETGNVHEVLTQPFKIAALPVMFDQKDNFAYSTELQTIPLHTFDLIILSDIECYTVDQIYKWIEPKYLTDYVVALGSKRNSIPVDETRMVYRPWWMYNLMKLNQFESTDKNYKPFMFDVLLGTRRPHRDYVMMALQKHCRLLDNSVVTYRDIFTGGFVDDQSQAAIDCFPNETLAWPYVSSNLNLDWEVSDNIEKNISPILPYNIYRNTWFTAVCETQHTASTFFLTEKTSKPLFAKRLFVMFAPRGHLDNLQKLGFETFGDVIDESYDYEQIDVRRYQMVFDQMLSLSQQNPVKVLAKIKEKLEHNHHRMWQLQQETQTDMQKLLLKKIPNQFIISADAV